MIMKISIITISWNASRTIEKTIKSVVDQKNADTEYIIIDGGSTDGTTEIIEQYKDQIDFYVSERDNGISDAFNKGITHATGDVIGIINADDILLDGALDHIRMNMNSDTDVFFGRVSSFSDIIDIPRVYISKSFKKTNIDRLRYEMVISHPATFIRNRAYKKYGMYNIEYRNSMDRELLLRMYLGGAIFQETPYVLSLFRTGGTTGNSFNRSINESYLISKKYGGNPIIIEFTRMKKQLYYSIHNRE